jgi:hypothetical protein
MVQTRLHKHSLSKAEQAVSNVASRASVRDPIDEFQEVYGSRAASADFRQQLGSDFSQSGQFQPPIQAKPSFRGLSQELAPIQAKLTVGPANDRYEQEADRVAAQVVQRIYSPVSEPSTKAESVQRQEEDEELQLKPIAPIQRKDMSAGGEVSTDLESEINRARGGGQALAPELRLKMGEAMGADFSGVRVHTDGRADALNQSVGARAFTTGQDLFFKGGEYQPGSRGGQELIAHELTHIVQQNPRSTTGIGLQEHSTEINRLNHVDKTIQRTVMDAIRLANQYLSDQEDYYTPLNTLADIDRLRAEKFTDEQYANLIHAIDAKAVRDASGAIVPFKPLEQTQKDDLAQRKKLLQELSPLHLQILKYLESQVNMNFGHTGLNEFYRGAHIVFNDQGLIYDELFDMASSLAIHQHGMGDVYKPNAVMDKTTAAGSAKQAAIDYFNPLYNPFDISYEHDIPQDAHLSPEQLAAGKMFKRRAGTSETSHYKSESELQAADPHRPQLGIDFPLKVRGHVLFGVVPNGANGYNTFVQTEGAGFQNLHEHIYEHGKGAFWNLNPVTKGAQTGLIGSTYASEKKGTHLQA